MIYLITERIYQLNLGGNIAERVNVIKAFASEVKANRYIMEHMDNLAVLSVECDYELNMREVTNEKA